MFSMDETDIILIDSLRIFLSYNTKDKKEVGKIKNHLSYFGFEVFLAHEDITPTAQWQDEIKKNLKKCDIFIPVLTSNFMDSEWTNQEIGFAIALDKFIIPLQCEILPPGFLGTTQSLRRNIRKGSCENIAEEIVSLVKNNDTFGKQIKATVINNLENSSTFEKAKDASKLLKEFDSFSKKEINRIADITINTRCVRDSFGARRVLKKIFNKYKRFLTNEKYSKVMKSISRPQLKEYY